MKRLLLLSLCVILSYNCFSQETKALYDEKADAVAQIKTAVKQASGEGKYVVCQVGGNWCPWCIRFSNFITQNDTINQIVKENFIYIHVNYSAANKNPEAMKMLANPARFGFPVLVILDEKGKVIHIQDSSYLEEGQGYDAKKVEDFFKKWTPKAVATLK